jgi:hypothetical protein
VKGKALEGCDGIRPPATPHGWAQVLSIFPPVEKAIGTRSEKRSGHDVRGSFLSACGVPLSLTPLQSRTYDDYNRIQQYRTAFKLS